LPAECAFLHGVINFPSGFFGGFLIVIRNMARGERAGFDAVLQAHALVSVHQHYAVVHLCDGVRAAGFQAGGFFAVVAGQGKVLENGFSIFVVLLIPPAYCAGVHLIIVFTGHGASVTAYAACLVIIKSEHF
jgi:hypothetical protein